MIAREGGVRLSGTAARPAKAASWLAALGFVAAIVCLAPSATAANKYWIGSSGQWNVSGNWNPSGQPQAGDNVYLTQSDAIDRIVTYYNTTNPNAVLDWLTIDATGTGAMTLDLASGDTLKVTTECVGDYGTGTLNIEAGGQVSGSSGRLGHSSGSTGTATVTGAGSTWTHSNAIHVGYGGSGTLNIEAGGQVIAYSDTVGHGCGYVGVLAGSTGTVTVTGEGSTWSNSDLYVGCEGAGTLNIEAGGKVIAYSDAFDHGWGYVGRHAGSTGTATVTGEGSTWTNSGRLYVGDKGAGTLNIEAGGQVSNTSGYVGYESGSTGTVTVTGAGSTWKNPHGLCIGWYGNGTLNIEAGGQVSITPDYWHGGCLGRYSGSTGTATVTGAGSAWTISGTLYVGEDGTGTLTVADGGLVSATTLWASPNDLFGNGTITAHSAVLDADLVFDSTHGPTQTLAFGTGGTLNLSVDGTGDLGVGHKGTGTLRVADGQTVASMNGDIGYRLGSTGTATVTGDGSTWTNSEYLRVGWYGTGTLNIEAGGQVSNASDGHVGRYSGSTGTATVTGDGSTWTNGGSLHIGYEGAGTLNVEAGGKVSNTRAYLGRETGSTGTATVTGEGSAWTNSGTLYVGYNGAGTLNIEAGGQVSSASAYLGYWSGSPSTATVTGDGSTWTDSGDLYIGEMAAGTLNIEAGGQVNSTRVYVGSNLGYTSIATVTGDGSTWTNSGDLYVGGRSTAAGGTGSVTVTDGGQVAVGGVLKLCGTASDVTVDASTVSAGALEGTNGTIRITDPAGGTALTVGSAASDTFSGVLRDDTGPGSLTKIGTGTQVLAGGGITYTGATTVLEGLLKLTDTTAFASDITNDAIVGFEATTGTWTFDEALGGAGMFVKSGDGTLVIAGLQDYDPGALFDVLGGTMVLETDAGSAGADLSISVTGAELRFACNQHLDTLTIEDDGLVRLTGAGVVVVQHLIINGIDLGETTLTPEPATLALVSLGVLSLLARRRK